jgi:hypothetical protein
MRIARALILLPLLALVASCVPVPSLNPLFNVTDIFIDPSLVGTWMVMERKGEGYPLKSDFMSPLKFEAGPDNAYRLIVTFKPGAEGRYSARLVRIKDYVFVDMMPDPPADDDIWAYFYFMPVHIFGRIWIEGDTVRLAFLDQEWLNKKIERGELRMPQTQFDDNVWIEKAIEDADRHAYIFAGIEEVKGTNVLTATTNELQRFAEKYAEDKKAFAVKFEFHRQK